MTEEVFGKFTELAVNNVAALLLGIVGTLWYIYVKNRLDDHVREAYKTLINIEKMLEHFYGKQK